MQRINEYKSDALTMKEYIEEMKMQWLFSTINYFLPITWLLSIGYGVKFVTYNIVIHLLETI